jgi:hypothetical protein
MQDKARNRRINGAALESIMQDVLRGMQEFTHDVCCGSDASGLEIIAVEDPGEPARREAEILHYRARD